MRSLVMRLVICLLLLMLLVSSAQSKQPGNSSIKVGLLGSMTRNGLIQMNASNQTNVTSSMNITNQQDLTIAINESMLYFPVSNRFKNVVSPNSIQANNIAYRFTT